MDAAPTNPAFPLALPAPGTPVTILSQALMQEVIAQSRLSPRRRIICPFHQSAGDSLHRMLNAIQPHSYIPPHRHLNPPKAESIVVLQGSIGYLTFSDLGAVEQMHVLGANRPAFGVDTQPGIFHTFLSLEEDTVLFEVKPGPYEKASDKDFAPWAPREGSDGAKAYLDQLYRLCGKKG
jgi:cupin fold WbuC family metalloprotein